MRQVGSGSIGVRLRVWKAPLSFANSPSITAQTGDKVPYKDLSRTFGDRPDLILTLITGEPLLARAAEHLGVDRIMVDLETRGKSVRQAGHSLFLSRHRLVDVLRVSSVLQNAEVLVRINPMHQGSAREIQEVLDRGADLIMLPMVQNAAVAAAFVEMVRGRATTSLLLETKSVLEEIHRVVTVEGVDEIHIGLNDLRLSCGYANIFSAVATGLIDQASEVVRCAGIRFGFGGMVSPDRGRLPISPDRVIGEHVRLGSTHALLGRSFRARYQGSPSPELLKEFGEDIRAIRRCYSCWSERSKKELKANHLRLAAAVKTIENASEGR